MISNVLSINRKGLSHERCEDSIYVDNINGVYVVCDGVSNSVNGGEGAKALCEYIGEKLSHESAKDYLAHKSVQDIRQTLIGLIKQCTDLTTERLACRPDDLASTLIVVSVYDDIVTVLHAGDGAVFAAPEVYEDETPILVSYPDNDAKQRVFPAASPLQLERMRVIRIHTSDVKCIAFGSDGFTDPYLRPHTSGFDGYGLHAVFKINNNDELEELIENKHLKRPAITDDISAVIIKFDNGIEYTGKPQANPVPTQTNSENKIVIKDTNKELDVASNEVVPINDKAENNTENKTFKIILMILSILVIFSMIAVCVFGYSMKSTNQGYDKQLTSLSEQVSSLQERVSELEKVEETTQETTLDDNVSDNNKENTSERNENNLENENNLNRQELTTNNNTTSQPSTTNNYARY